MLSGISCSNVFFSKWGNMFARPFFLQSNFHFLFTYRGEQRRPHFVALRGYFLFLKNYKFYYSLKRCCLKNLKEKEKRFGGDKIILNLNLLIHY